jgi:hypothetical protein
MHIHKHKMKLKHVAFMHLSPHIGETFKNWNYILLIWHLSLSTSNFEETLIVVIKYRDIAEMAISGVIETINSTTNYIYFLLVK